ncbi:MAG TPA: pitrilysin family protein [Pyrinomonadaceae bacterium]|nr:pitrilysin family protein [Pyrinomonadaceae bacterium]
MRKTAPGPLEPAPFNIPEPFITTLDNGLKVVILADKRLPLVSYRLAFLSGDANDPRENAGITSAMASMLTEGTVNYSSLELAEKVERLGAHLGASSSEDFVIVSASSLSIYSTEILQLIGEIVFRATFPEAELDLYRRNTIENLKFQRSQPGFLANEQVASILYGEHPYARVSPSAEDIEKLSRDAIAEFYGRQLLPNNAILIAVGDIEKDEFLREVADQFGKWKGSELPVPTFAAPPTRAGRSLTIVDRPGSAQTNIVLANIAFERNHPDYFPALVMNQILGAGASSRVFMNLREEKGYTYGAYTRLDAKRSAGDFEATAEVRTQVTGDSLREFFYELERIRTDRVSDEELADAKNFLTGVFPIRAETQEGLTNLIVNQQLYDLPADYLQTYRANVEAISAVDVERVANKYIQPDSLAIVLVGDAKDVLPQVRSYTDQINILDTVGNKMDLASYEEDPNAEEVDVAGTWELSLDFQGQQLPVTLTLEQNGERISGKIETVLGSGNIDDGTVKGDRITATANTEIQGQSVEFSITGSVKSDSMSGTLSAPIIPDSLSFEGKRTS